MNKTKNRSRIAFALMAIAIIATVLVGSLWLLGGADVMGKKSGDWCFNAGFDDGRDSVFSQPEFSTCGSSYEHGFMKGCLSVDGNTRDVCNSAEDAG